VVALAVTGLGSSGCTVARDRYCIDTGISVVSGSHAVAPNSDATSSAAADSDADSADTGSADTGSADTCSPDARAHADTHTRTTHSASASAYRSTDGNPNAASVPNADSHAAAPSPNADIGTNL